MIKLGDPGELYEIDLDFCKGCGICVAECPCGAIEMVFGVEGTRFQAGSDLSPAVAAAVQAVAEAVLREREPVDAAPSA